MQSGGVKVGEKLYLPGLPVCFCKQIARSNENGSKIENQELLGKQKISNATTRNAQSITFVCLHNEKFIMSLSLQVHGYIFLAGKKEEKKKPNITNPTIQINLQQGFWRGRRWVWLRRVCVPQGEQGPLWALPRLQHSSMAVLCVPTLKGQQTVLGGQVWGRADKAAGGNDAETLIGICALTACKLCLDSMGLIVWAEVG